jgi:hypothetical protein
MSEDYFTRKAIGSSDLGGAIVSVDPLEVCCDRLTVPVKPTGFMENGKAFEDLIEQEFSGKDVFNDKYFVSDISKIPEYKGGNPDIRQILDILDIKSEGEPYPFDPKRHAAHD